MALSIIGGYAILGFLTGLALAVHDVREQARKNQGAEPGVEFWAGLLLWPLAWLIFGVQGVWTVSEKLIYAAARAEKLPEVVERKQKELERELL